MRNETQKIIEELDLDKLNISGQVRQLLAMLLNLVEELLAEIRNLKVERQELRDEVNRLKGEQGKPKIKANKKENEQATSKPSKEEQKKKSKQKENHLRPSGGGHVSLRSLVAFKRFFLLPFDFALRVPPFYFAQDRQDMA